MWLTLLLLSVASAAAAAQEPFVAIAEPAYVGVGQADLKKLSLRSARDVALLRAQRSLTRAICDPTNEKKEVKALLPGERNTDEIRVGNTLWVRIWIPKEKVQAERVCFN